MRKYFRIGSNVAEVYLVFINTLPSQNMFAQFRPLYMCFCQMYLVHFRKYRGFIKLNQTHCRTCYSHKRIFIWKGFLYHEDVMKIETLRSPGDSHKKGPVMWRSVLPFLLAWSNCWKIVEFPVIWDAMTIMWRHCNGISSSYKKLYHIAIYTWDIVVFGWRWISPYPTGLLHWHWNNRYPDSQWSNPGRYGWMWRTGA